MGPFLHLEPRGFEKSSGKSPQYQQGPCPGTPTPAAPHIPTQAFPVSSTPGPGAHRGPAPWERVRGGRGQAPVSPLGCQGGTGLAAMPAHPPASASLPPRCHSNALRPPPQHPAAQGLDRGTWGWHSSLSPPHTALGLEQTVPVCPRIPLPPPATESTAPRLSLPFSGEKRDAHAAASAASSPRSTQDRGLLCAQRGLGAMEVMKHWGEKPRLGPPLYSARTHGWHRGARPRKARDRCLIFGPTSRRGWHFKNFTEHPRCCRSSDRWTGLAGGVHSPHGAARKAMVAFALGGGGYMLAVIRNWYSAQISLKIKNLSDLFQVAGREAGPCAQAAEALLWCQHKQWSKLLAFFGGRKLKKLTRFGQMCLTRWVKGRVPARAGGNDPDHVSRPKPKS